MSDQNQDFYRNIAEQKENEGKQQSQSEQDLGYVDPQHQQKGMEEKAKEIDQRVEYTVGTQPVNMDDLPSKGYFYPKETQIGIKAATTEEIRHFSSMDETDSVDFMNKLNMILNKCVEMWVNGSKVSYKNLLEVDRFYLVFAVRDFTFKDKPNKLTIKGDDGSGSTFDIELTSAIFPTLEIPEKLKPFYSEQERCFVFKSKHEEVGEFRIYVPQVGSGQSLVDYMREKQRNNESYDASALKYVPYIAKHYKEISTNDKIEMKMGEVKGWSYKKEQYILDAVQHLEESYMDLGYIITDEEGRPPHHKNFSGEEVRTPISFPRGFKALFIEEDALSEFE
jgi:hypothetical protein